MGGARIATPGEIETMLRLSRKLHTCDDPAARKKHMLDGLCELLGAHSAISVVAHVERIPRRHTLVSVTRLGHPAIQEEHLLGRYLPALRAMPHRSLTSSH